MLELIMGIWGLVVLISGKCSFYKNNPITGSKARRCGLILIAPALFAILVIIPASISGHLDYPFPAILLEFAVLVPCWISIYIIAEKSKIK